MYTYECMITGEELKKRLFKSLKSVIAFKYALKFCDLLVSCKKLIVPLLCDPCDDYSLPSSDKQKIDAIFGQLKEVIAAASAKILIKKFSDALVATKIKRSDARKLQSLMLKINDSNINSQEFLILLIPFMDYLASLYCVRRVCYGSFLMHDVDISALRYYVECAAWRDVERILELIFILHIDCIEISSKGQKELQELLLEVADIIENNVKERRALSVVLQKRSAIQFILDFYINSECSMLPENVNKISNCKGILDDIIETMYYVRGYEYDEGEADLEKAGRSRVPLTHSWWRKCPRWCISRKSKVICW